MKAHLSTRIRPNSEAAPWVIEEVRKLEAEVERLREVVRQVHGLVDGVTMIALPEAVRMLADIHKITKGVVE